MARPDAQLSRNLRKESRRGVAVARYTHHRVTELPVTRTADLPSQHVGHQLHPIADAKYGDPQFENLRVALRRPLLGDALRPPGEHDSSSLLCAQLLDGDVE